MRRRQLLQTLAAAPLAAQAQTNPNARPAPAAGAEGPPKLETTPPDAVAETVPRFLNTAQFASLRALAAILMPPLNGAPGALEARAPEFLDFLLGESPAERQQLYRAGLDALDAAARGRFSRPFAALDPAQAEPILAPLRAPWSFQPPAGALERFLQAAKSGVRTATTNSREYIQAAASGRRGMGGQGLYWYPLD